MSRRRRRSFGAPAEVHHERAKSTLREIRRLRGHLRQQLKNPPDCIHAFHLVTALASQEGALQIDRHESARGRGPGGAGYMRRLLDRFEKACVVHPKSIRAARRVHAVWR